MADPENLDSDDPRDDALQSVEDAANARKDDRTDYAGTSAFKPARKKGQASTRKTQTTPHKGTKRSIEARKAAQRTVPQKPKRLESPRWWAPLFVTLMVLGLLVVVLAYVLSGDFPIKGLGNGNLFIGFGMMIAGFLMTLGWR